MKIWDTNMFRIFYRDNLNNFKILYNISIVYGESLHYMANVFVTLHILIRIICSPIVQCCHHLYGGQTPNPKNTGSHTYTLTRLRKWQFTEA